MCVRQEFQLINLIIIFFSSVSDTKSNQQKVQILQDIPCNISLKTESEKRITQEPDSKSPSKNTAEPSKSTRDSSKNTGETSKQKINALTSADRWSSGDCDNIDKRTCACSCKCHVDKEDDYSKWCVHLLSWHFVMIMVISLFCIVLLLCI